MKKESIWDSMSTKETISTATAEGGRGGEVRDTGSFSNDLHAVEKWIARLRKAHGKSVRLRACYEAGPCGFGLARRLRQLGVECEVVAPSLIPIRAGERIKTDRRPAENMNGKHTLLFNPKLAPSRLALSHKVWIENSAFISPKRSAESHDEERTHERFAAPFVPDYLPGRRSEKFPGRSEANGGKNRRAFEIRSKSRWRGEPRCL